MSLSPAKRDKGDTISQEHPFEQQGEAEYYICK